MGVFYPTSPSPFADNPAGTPLIGYDNIITAANISSSTAAAGFPITNLANPATHLLWKGGVNTGDEFITINLSGQVTDYIAIAGHNFGTSRISVTITDAGASPPTVLMPTTTPPVNDDSPLIFRFARAAYSQIQIALNLSFVPDDGAPQIAAMYCGSLLVLERGVKVDVTHVPITFGRMTSVVNGMSESGNFLGRIVLAETRTTKAEFFGFTPDFYRNNIDAFLDAAQEIPFFWAWAPIDYPLEAGYAWLTNNPHPEVSPDHRRIALTLEMNGIA